MDSIGGVASVCAHDGAVANVTHSDAVVAVKHRSEAKPEWSDFIRKSFGHFTRLTRPTRRFGALP